MLLSGILALFFLHISFTALHRLPDDPFTRKLASAAILFLTSGSLSYASIRAETMTRFYEIAAQFVFAVAVLLLTIVLLMAVLG
jgi:tRNA A37 threonylcarbamoyladenosine synthetase subunit TsaC/SUA5/YrdC